MHLPFEIFATEKFQVSLAPFTLRLEHTPGWYRFSWNTRFAERALPHGLCQSKSRVI